MNIEPVGNRDRCGRCGSRHGGNNHHCPVHGSVTNDCCKPACNKKDWITLKDVYTNGNLKSIKEVLASSADLTGYKREGRGFDLPMYTRKWERTSLLTSDDILVE